jgi:hypothetical protein
MVGKQLQTSMSRDATNLVVGSTYDLVGERLKKECIPREDREQHFLVESLWNDMRHYHDICEDLQNGLSASS